MLGPEQVMEAWEAFITRERCDLAGSLLNRGSREFGLRKLKRVLLSPA